MEFPYRFRDPGLATLALTHRSAGKPNNERMEFLGDALLGALVAELLFEAHPNASEGELSRLRAQPTLRVTPPYYEDEAYIEALATSIEGHLATLSFKPELIVASFHGMPKSYVDKGDPYQGHCVATTEALRRRLGMNASNLLLTFQSRFGNDEWLQPYTDKTIEELAKKGTKRLAVVTPGFAADCLETLEEIAQENAHIFKANGGEEFSAIPCLNDSDGGMNVIRQLVLRELQGWI